MQIIRLLLALVIFFAFVFNSKAQVVLNEVLPQPSGAQGMVPGGLEWIEVYNPTCDPIDISGWKVACRSSFGTGGAMEFPSGTIIPPLGFRVLGNGQGVVGPFCNTGNWVMQNIDGWIALYNASDNPIHGIFWTGNPAKINNSGDADYGVNPCNIGGGNLANAYQINQSGLMTHVGGTPAAGTIVKRMPDGGAWTTGGTHTPLACNNPSICPSPVIAMATASPSTITCGNSSTLTASPSGGGFTINWSTGQSGPSINVMPLTTTTYTVTITGGPCPGGSTAQVTVTVGSCCEADAGNFSVPNQCPGASFTATATGFNNTSPYTQTYFMTNGSGVILAISPSGSFTAPTTCGTYTIHSYNYLTGGTGITLPTVGANVSGINCSPPNPCCDREPTTFTVAATVTMPPNGSAVVACPDLAVQPTPPAVNNSCGTALTSSGPQITGNPVCSGYKTYSWTYTDVCNGTTYVWEFNYFVSPPVVSMPANQGSTVACPSAATAPPPPDITDNCGRMLTRTGPTVSPPTITCAGTQTFDWTYTDCTGATYLWQYQYIISDPTVIMPANINSTVSCPSAIVPPTPPSVNDNCGRLLSVTGPSISGPDCGGAKIYQYTYTDCDNNTYIWTHTFNVNPPTVSMPPNGASTVPCPANAVTPTPPASLMDNCGNLLSVSGPNESPDPSCGGTKTFTWTYTDCANNTYNWVYTYTINPPTAGTIPSDGSSTVACVSDVFTPTSPDVNDSCGNPMQKAGPVISPDPPCGGQKTFIWTFTACNGQQYPWVYTYTINPPTSGNLPPNGAQTVSCIADATTPVPPNINDSCGNTMTRTGPTVSPNPACSGTKTYTWTYLLCTGSSVTWDFVYTISDPIISLDCPSDITICESPSGVYTVGVANANSNCGGTINMGFVITGSTNRTGTGNDASGSFNPGVSTITWTTTNTCGNTLSCSTTIDITPTPSLSIVSAQCDPTLTTYSVVFTASGGTISVTPAGIVSGNSIINIPVGTNIVITADDGGCQTQLPITAPNCSCPSIPVPTGNGYSICADETIVDFVANIVSPYDIRWFTTPTGGTPVASGSTFTPSMSGTWYAEGYDPTTMCVSLTRLAFALTIHPLPVASVSGPLELCTGNNVIVNALGGVNYSWSNNGGNNAQAVYTGLGSGSFTFTVTVTDANGCTDTDNHIVQISQQPSLSITNVTCAPNLSTYNIAFTATGGTITTTSGTISGNTIVGVDTSITTVTITVTNPTNTSCKVNETVPRPNCKCPNLSAPLVSAQAICNGATTMTPFVASVPAGMQINWYSTLLGGTPILANNLSFIPNPIPNVTTTYYVATFDPLTKCESSRAPFILTVNATPQMTKPNNIKVCGGDPIPTINFNGGPTGTAYNWQNNNTSTGLAVSGSGNIPTWNSLLVTGSQTSLITVTPSIGVCSGTPQSFSITIDEKPTLTINNVSCAPDLKTYSIAFTSQGGSVVTSAGTISGNMITGIDTSIITVNVTITNLANNACVVTIPVPRPNCKCPNLSAPTGAGQSFCSGAMTISPLVASVAAGIQVKWYTVQTGGIAVLSNNPSFTPNPIPSVTTTYYAAAFDPATNCESARTPLVLTVNPLPNITISGDTRVCKNTSTTLTATGGSNYIWSNLGGNQSNTTYSNLQSTQTFTVTVTTANGCKDSKSVSIQVDPLPVLNITTDCGQGENSGIIKLSATSGSGGTLRYFLDGVDVGNQTTFSNLSNKDYTVKVVEQNSGCEAESTSTINCGCPTITISGDSIVCQNGFKSLLQTGGGTGAWTVVPTNAGIININGQFTASSSYFGNAEIRFTSSGCVGKTLLRIAKQISATLEAVSPLCFDERNGQISIIDVQGGKPQYDYTLNNKAVSFPVKDLDSGQYKVEISDGIGCIYSKTITLENPSEWEITDITVDKTIIIPNEVVMLKAVVNLNQSDIKSISWTPAVGLSCPTCLETSAKPSQTTTYQLLITDKNGCTDTKSIKIEVGIIDIVFPNIINPKSSSGNSTFFVTGNQDFIEGINQMYIYDRWGNKVFSIENATINDPNQGWNGTFGGADVVPGVFTFYIKLMFKNGKTEDFIGDISVIK